MAAYVVIIWSFITNHTGSVIINDAQDVRSHLVSVIWNHREELINGTLFDVVESVEHILSCISYHEESLINDTEIEALKTAFEGILPLLSRNVGCMMYFTVMDSISYALCGLGILANTLAFNMFGKMGYKNSNTMLIRTLAVIDSLFLLLSIFTGRTSSKSYYPYALSLYIQPVRIASQIFAVWTSILLGINRYIVVCRPLMASSWCTISRVKKQLIIVLCWAVIYVIPLFFEVESTQAVGRPEYEVYVTYKPWAINYYYAVIYQNALPMIFVSIVPLLLQVLFSILIGIALLEARRRRQEMGANITNGDHYVTRLVLGVLIVFIVCYIPVTVSIVLRMVQGNNGIRCGSFLFYYHQIALIFVLLNSSVNCLIYITLNPNFRKTLRLNVVSCRISTDLS